MEMRWKSWWCWSSQDNGYQGDDAHSDHRPVEALIDQLEP
jgi:hypothetical protein